MVDYAAPNQKKAKAKEVPEKKEIKKVVTAEVVVKKKGLGKKFKETFIAMDLGSVFHFVVREVFIPAARNMIVDGATRGVDRMVYGDRAPRRPPGYTGTGRSSYGGSPIITDYRHPSTRPPIRSGPAAPRRGGNDFILETKEEADTVLQSMYDLLEMYEYVTVGELHELLGLPSAFTDQKWGWTHLTQSHVQPTREGYLIVLPPMEALG